VSNIAQNQLHAGFLANSGLANRLRKLADPPPVPTDAEIAAALAQVEGDIEREWGGGSRRARRATASAERRSTEAPPTPRRKLTRAELKRREHERTQDRAYAAALERRSVDWKPTPVKRDESGKEWRTVPREVWRMCQDLVSNTSSAAWRYWARRCSNKPALGAIRRAALLPRANGSTCGRTFGSERARRIAALGLALVQLGVHTARKGPWRHVVRGIPVALMQELLTYPDGTRRPHENTIIGHHRGLGSEHDRGQAGYLRALEATGLVSSQQWYPEAADWECGRLLTFKDGKSRRAQINRYWLIGDPPMKANDPALLELEREGWRSLDEHPVSVPRRDTRPAAVPAAPS
jgi:hypothetical protein